jgi:hypothetical protein
MRGAKFIVPFLAFLVIVPTWAGEEKCPQPSRSLADDLRELTKVKGEGEIDYSGEWKRKN